MSCLCESSALVMVVHILLHLPPLWSSGQWVCMLKSLSSIPPKSTCLKLCLANSEPLLPVCSVFLYFFIPNGNGPKKPQKQLLLLDCRLLGNEEVMERLGFSAEQSLSKMVE